MNTLILKPSLSLMAAAVMSFAAGGAWADQALAQAKNCISCHGVDKKMVGPAFKEISAKYASDKDAAKHLAEKIQKGSTPGKGNWGPVPMPANPQVTEAEAGKLAAWVLSLK